MQGLTSQGLWSGYGLTVDFVNKGFIGIEPWLFFLFYLWLLCTATAENSYHIDYMTLKPEVLLFDPVQKQFADPWSRSTLQFINEETEAQNSARLSAQSLSGRAHILYLLCSAEQTSFHRSFALARLTYQHFLNMVFTFMPFFVYVCFMFRISFPSHVKRLLNEGLDYIS